ncbi:hypothetical protein H9Y05_15640 [Crocinitomicaceae bacterium CZZ-1]|uniref:Uncharacterized protein n=1 Tax=Taishania pollutisoli TaxID=2766479 RepID=A0A8J6P872_9FLAO|nr:hypothetical protein [Taishania pollutisoli]MBC9813909.1 hypothetical protein [Taishania pollutisoli]
MPELTITNKNLNDEYSFLPNSKNVIIKNLTIKLETDEINLKLFSETKIELLKKDPNIGPSGMIYYFDYNKNDFVSNNIPKELDSNEYGYYYLFDTNGKQLKDIDFTIFIQYEG